MAYLLPTKVSRLFSSSLPLLLSTRPLLLQPLPPPLESRRRCHCQAATAASAAAAAVTAAAIIVVVIAAIASGVVIVIIIVDDAAASVVVVDCHRQQRALAPRQGVHGGTIKGSHDDRAEGGGRDTMTNDGRWTRLLRTMDDNDDNDGERIYDNQTLHGRGRGVMVAATG